MFCLFKAAIVELGFHGIKYTLMGRWWRQLCSQMHDCTSEKKLFLEGSSAGGTRCYKRNMVCQSPVFHHVKTRPGREMASGSQGMPQLPIPLCKLHLASIFPQTDPHPHPTPTKPTVNLAEQMGIPVLTYPGTG